MKPQNCNFAAAARTWVSGPTHGGGGLDANLRAIYANESVKEQSSEVANHHSTLQLTDDRQDMLVIK